MGNKTDKEVTFQVTLLVPVAVQLAQFCKRSLFDTFYECTEAHLSHEERKELAYRMIAGIEAIQGALRESGVSVR